MRRGGARRSAGRAAGGTREGTGGAGHRAPHRRRTAGRPRSAARGRQVRADLVRPTGERAKGQQRVPVRRGERPRTRSWTLGHRRTTAIRCRSRGSRPIGASTRPRGDGAARHARGRGTPSRCSDRRTGASGSPARASVFATTIRPLVSLSRRWTIPGRPTPAIDPSGLAAVARPPEERVDERAAAVPRRRMHDQPGGLVDDEHRRRPRRRCRAGSTPASASRPAGAVSSTRTVSPPTQPVARSSAGAIDQGATVADEALRMGPADARHARDREIDATGGRRPLDRAILRRHHPSACADARRSAIAR